MYTFFKNIRTKKRNWKLAICLPFIALAISFVLSSHTNEEGMFPLNLVNYGTLQQAGLQLNEDEIFKPGKTTLSDALVRIDGCTGSFISKDGLVITNHHCVMGSIANLSTLSQNYLEKGFVAQTKEVEIPLGKKIRITQSYEDVSLTVLDGVNASLSAVEKNLKIESNIERIEKNAKELNAGYESEVSEMFVGKSYMLFTYLLIEDIRLVVAPPNCIGQFGGDTDNWEWPRHGGDFSIVRAYVGKDGKPAKYSKDNVPYTPKKFLKIDASGAKENDFIFILGYPGTTFRNKDAHFQQYQEQYTLPITQKFYSWQINTIKEIYKNNDAKLLSYAGKLQGLENTEKNFRGKIQGLRRSQLVQSRIEEDEAMSVKIPASVSTLVKLKSLWKSQSALATKFSYYQYLIRNSYIGKQWFGLYMAAKSNDTSKYNKIARNYNPGDVEFEKLLLNNILTNLTEQNKDVKTWYNPLKLQNLKDLMYKIGNKNEPFIKINKFLTKNALLTSFFTMFETDITQTIQNYITNEEEILALQPAYVTYREQFKEKGFIPDANGTLRLTYGYIKGFNPNDGTYNAPFSTLDGVWQKMNTKADYTIPKIVADQLRVSEPKAYFLDKKTNKVAVNLLYNLDTTGGNSGSPILNSKGELIGVNFDRSFTATINDYAWNQEYSRSLGVDIRYVMYILNYVSNATETLKELNVNF